MMARSSRWVCGAQYPSPSARPVFSNVADRLGGVLDLVHAPREAGDAGVRSGFPRLGRFVERFLLAVPHGAAQHLAAGQRSHHPEADVAFGVGREGTDDGHEPDRVVEEPATAGLDRAGAVPDLAQQRLLLGAETTPVAFLHLGGRVLEGRPDLAHTVEELRVAHRLDELVALDGHLGNGEEHLGGFAQPGHGVADDAQPLHELVVAPLLGAELAGRALELVVGALMTEVVRPEGH
jgi:hypothetical protein